MTTLDIANKLVDLCKQGKNADAKALYSEAIVSIEAFARPTLATNWVSPLCTWA